MFWGLVVENRERQKKKRESKWSVDREEEEHLGVLNNELEIYFGSQKFLEKAGMVGPALQKKTVKVFQLKKAKM